MAGRGRPTTEVPKGETLYRVHTADKDARSYGRHDATSRWDDPDGRHGVLYLGLTPEGAFTETLLRKPEQKAVVWNEIEKRRLARFRATETLRLADMHGKGLRYEGKTVSQIGVDHDGTNYPGTYAATQDLSAAIRATTDLDGIAYRSRLNPDQLCVALFDRADHKVELVEDGEPIDCDWVEDLLEAQGKNLVDP